MIYVCVQFKKINIVIDNINKINKIALLKKIYMEGFLMKKILGYFAILLMILSLFANCAKKEEQSAPQVEEKIKIGAIFAYTGPASFLGEPEKKTAEMLAEKINSQGGVLGKKIELIVKDTAGDPQKALNAIKELVQKDGVVAIIGPTTSGVSLAIKNEMNNMQTPLISCAASEDIVVPIEESKWIFKTPQSDRIAIEKIFELIKEKKITKIGLITADKGFGLGGAKQAEKLAPQFNIQIVANEKFSSEDPDVNTQITKIKSKKPQAILCWDTDKGSAKVIKSIRTMKLDVPVYMSHGIANDGYLMAAGEAGNGVILPCGRLVVLDQLADTHPQKALLKSYSDEYMAKYNEKPNQFGGYAYDSLMILVEAIKKANSTDKEQIRSAIEQIKNFSGTAGTYNFSETDHNGLDKSAFCIVEVKDGKWVLVQE